MLRSARRRKEVLERSKSFNSTWFQSGLGLEIYGFPLVFHGFSWFSTRFPLVFQLLELGNPFGRPVEAGLAEMGRGAPHLAPAARGLEAFKPSKSVRFAPNSGGDGDHGV